MVWGFRGDACPGAAVQGALVANYPWDGSEDRGTHYEACPDDAAYVHLARVYAGAHARMAAPGGAGHA